MASYGGGADNRALSQARVLAMLVVARLVKEGEAAMCNTNAVVVVAVAVPSVIIRRQ